MEYGAQPFVKFQNQPFGGDMQIVNSYIWREEQI